MQIAFLNKRRKNQFSFKSFQRNYRKYIKFSITGDIMYCKSKLSKNTFTVINQHDNYVKVFSQKTRNVEFILHVKSDKDLITKLIKFEIL